MSKPDRTMTRPLRADAARNRRAVLDAAARLFAERGFDVPMAEIADAAGVGRSTLLRNFPTRSDLAFAVFDQGMTDLRELAARQTGQPGDFEALLDLKLDIYVRNGGLVEAAQRGEGLSKDFSAERLEVAEMFQRAAASAVAAGRMRPSLGVETFVVMLQALSGAMLSGGTEAERRRKAQLVRRLLLDGLYL